MVPATGTPSPVVVMLWLPMPLLPLKANVPVPPRLTLATVTVGRTAVVVLVMVHTIWSVAPATTLQRLFAALTTVGVVEPRLEVWLFDFDEDLYGQTIETELIAFLRPEAKFDSVQAMVDQIRIDADQARALLMAAF